MVAINYFEQRKERDPVMVEAIRNASIISRDGQFLNTHHNPLSNIKQDAQNACRAVCKSRGHMSETQADLVNRHWVVYEALKDQNRNYEPEVSLEVLESLDSVSRMLGGEDAKFDGNSVVKKNVTGKLNLARENHYVWASFVDPAIAALRELQQFGIYDDGLSAKLGQLRDRTYFESPLINVN